MKAKKTMIETKDLILKILTLADAKDIFNNYWRHKITAQYMLWKPLETQEEADELITNVIEFQKNGTSFCVYLKANGEAVGLAGVKDIGNGIIEDSGIGIGPSFTGYGYGTQITSALITFAFENLNTKLIRFSCFIDNIPSARMMEKCGFKFKYLSEENTRKWDGKKYISKIYEITYEEWVEKNKIELFHYAHKMQ